MNGRTSMTIRLSVPRRLAPLVATAACALLLASFASAAPDDVPGPGEPGGPTHPLSPTDQAKWLAGRAVFDRNFHQADGLGLPEMNADSCRACHQDPVVGGAGGLELNVSRFATNNGGSGPFQNLPGGQGLSKLRPPWEEGRENYDPNTADLFEQRQTPNIMGAGLIDAIPDKVILRNEDPLDRNNDGIRGVARILTINGQPEVGRFGWKAQVPHLSDFARDAMGGECGITTPDDGRGFAFVTDADATPDPELSTEDLDAIIFFMQKLGPPRRGHSTDPQVAQGEALFSDLRCDRCHIPRLGGPPFPQISPQPHADALPISEQPVEQLPAATRAVPLFSDLLLHDVMGPTFEGMEEPGAESGMYRTPPLWGIKDTAPYMHDGRAETLADAIAAHAGEATYSSTGFALATQQQRDALIAFLMDL